MIKRWQDFLDSLSTKGGNIFMLFVALGSLMAFLLHVSHDHSDASLVAVAHDLAVGFGGALLGGLSGSSSRQQMADRVETAIAGQKTSVTAEKVETVNVTPPEAK